MSFETLKKDDLLRIADEFGVDTKPTDTKAVIIAALAEDGVTWDQVASLDETVAERDSVLKAQAEEEKQGGTKQLLRMLRANSTYEIRGTKFTREHPFALVPEEDAEYITESDPEGFRYATPKEAAEYYG